MTIQNDRPKWLSKITIQNDRPKLPVQNDQLLEKPWAESKTIRKALAQIPNY